MSDEGENGGACCMCVCACMLPMRFLQAAHVCVCVCECCKTLKYFSNKADAECNIEYI